jgi:hypothetical protein
LNIVGKASDNTIGRTLKKNILKPHRNRQWVIPPEANAGFVAAMEDGLETYQRPRDADRPLVCLDETSKQWIAETRASIPATPGQPARHDYQYERNGVANLFMIFAPLKGWRRVEVTDRHAAVDYAKVLKDLSDAHFPAAEKIVLVQDNLSAHTPASLYAAFPAPEARRLVERFEWHYTPKHGSWLDMAESELAVLTRQCLSRRIPDKQTLEKEVVAWERHRNKRNAKNRASVGSGRPCQPAGSPFTPKLSGNSAAISSGNPVDRPSTFARTGSKSTNQLLNSARVIAYSVSAKRRFSSILSSRAPSNDATCSC